MQKEGLALKEKSLTKKNKKKGIELSKADFAAKNVENIWKETFILKKKSYWKRTVTHFFGEGATSKDNSWNESVVEFQVSLRNSDGSN